MEFLELNKIKAQEEFEKIRHGIPDNWYDKLNSSYKKIREDILKMIPETGVTKDYDFDLKFAIKLYQYFSKANFSNFDEATASNYDFWRYICIKVVPDIIEKRHSFVNTYYYAKDVRMYIPTLWWYIHISWQGDKDLNVTYNILKNFSTDYILNFVERTGVDGIYLEVIRTIFKYLSTLTPKQISDNKIGNQTLIRRLLIQNTAKTQFYNPVVEDNVDEYVKSLFKSCGIEV